MEGIRTLLEATRPRQWVKNLFVLAGVVFAGRLTEPGAVGRALEAMGLFCAASAGVYLLNDILDLDRDRQHPVKALRPLASGRLGIVQGQIAAGLLLAAALLLASLLGKEFLAITAGYVVLHTLYSALFKQVVILDVMTIAAGFVLRVVAGGVAVDVSLSPWLLTCTTLLALFVGFSKRRYELRLMEQEAQKHREVLGAYTPYLLDQMISVTASATVVTYTLYTMAPETVEKFHTPNLLLTVPFVLYGILRYLYLIHGKGVDPALAGGSPENALLGDRPMLLGVGLWAATAAAVIYL